ncbi:MAG TPA: hypothetical protein VE197_05285, partial [Mycobacterium sp.]|nr:hypothetical protein [Mycobacterium sp.]
TSSEDLAAAGVDHAAALLELNRLSTAWVETCFTAAPTPRPGSLRWIAGRPISSTLIWPETWNALVLAGALSGNRPKERTS